MSSPLNFLDEHGVVVITLQVRSIPGHGVENMFTVAALWLVQGRNPGYLWQSLEEVPG